MSARWTDVERAMLARLRTEGKTDAEMSAALGRPLDGLRWMLRRGVREGWVSRNPHYWTESERATHRGMLRAGKSNREIGEKLGRSSQSIWQQAKRARKAGKLLPPMSKPELSRLKSAGMASAFCLRIGIPVAAISDYRMLRRKDYTQAEAAAICRGEARP